MSTSKSFLEYVNDVDMDGLWSGSQGTSLLLLQSKFVSRWSLQFFSAELLFEKIENKQKRSGLVHFHLKHFLEKILPIMWWNILGCNHSSVDSSAPTILPPSVWVPSTPSMLLSFMVKFVLYLSCEKNEINKKRPGLARLSGGRYWPIPNQISLPRWELAFSTRQAWN